jgi:hypothetical protein
MDPSFFVRASKSDGLCEKYVHRGSHSLQSKMLPLRNKSALAVWTPAFFMKAAQSSAHRFICSLQLDLESLSAGRWPTMAPDLYGDLSLLSSINPTRFIRLFDFLGF